MNQQFQRLVNRVNRRMEDVAGQIGGSFALRLADSSPVVIGNGTPAATIVVNREEGIAALSTFDAATVADAYLHGILDVEGDLRRLLTLREFFSDRHPLRYIYRLARPILFGQVASDRLAIPEHYEADPDFFLLFLDRRHRCYSQGMFASHDEPVEDAMTTKLDFALEAIEARPGDRVLDIGGGWGSFMEYAGKKGIRVTSLTISEESRRFLENVAARENLPCEVINQHLFEHRPRERYDAIVNLGVTEHLPDYGRTLQCYAALLKPGGKVYLDASASREMHDESTFFERRIFRGNGTTVCLHKYLDEVARSPFEVECVHNDRVNYQHTARNWAENLDRNQAEIESRWGGVQYRRFRIYLWGCVDGFERDRIQAYRWVLSLPRSSSAAVT